MEQRNAQMNTLEKVSLALGTISIAAGTIAGGILAYTNRNPIYFIVGLHSGLMVGVVAMTPFLTSDYANTPRYNVKQTPEQ
jgi:hypothetical protein